MVKATFTELVGKVYMAEPSQNFVIFGQYKTWRVSEASIGKKGEGYKVIVNIDFQINMAVFFWYLVKSDLSGVRYCTPNKSLFARY